MKLKKDTQPNSSKLLNCLLGSTCGKSICCAFCNNKKCDVRCNDDNKSCNYSEEVEEKL